ncbi:MAG: hypothetical protein KKD44_28245 [Proteobacteria bacterium]|nr:hypothetical protein [Pseudomonadota bacterium]
MPQIRVPKIENEDKMLELCKTLNILLNTVLDLKNRMERIEKNKAEWELDVLNASKRPKMRNKDELAIQMYKYLLHHAEESEDSELPEEKRKWLCARCGNKFNAEPDNGEDKPACKCDATGSYISDIKF